mgnify:CR=1 FL=1
MVLAAQLLAAASVAMLAAPAVGRWLAIGWAVLAAAAALLTAYRQTVEDGDSASGAPAVRDAALRGLALAAVWSVPPLAFVLWMPGGDVAAIWMVLAILIAFTGYASASPAFAAAFVSGVGLAACGMQLLAGNPLFAGGTLCIAVLSVLTCRRRSRALALIRAGEVALAERDETVSLLLRDAPESGHWLWETDAQRRLSRTDPLFARVLGIEAAAANGRALVELLAGPTWQSGDFSPGLRALAERLKAREAFRDLSLPVFVAGEQRWWQVTANPRLDADGRFLGFRGVACDVTEARASAAKIARLARFDTLTGLPNRLQINEALAQAMAAAEQWNTRCAFMMIDLDRFKAINDTLGHPIGDRLLGRVSERLAQLVGASGTVGRLGGDEFAVVVRDGNDPAALERLARSIIDTVSRPYDIDQHTLFIGASVGIAVSPRDGRTAEMLVRSADLALYRSKDAGRGVFHFYEPQLHAVAEERRVLEIALRTAVENGELHCEYQPVANARDGSLVAFEALLRWTHPKLGQVSPAKFIPLAEDTRLIVAIGDWVLRSACAEAAGWDEHIRVSVNISPQQLHSPNFVRVVAQALARSDEAAAANAGRPSFGLSLGTSIAGGDFGTSQNSQLVSTALGARLSLGTLRLSASLPYLSVRSTGLIYSGIDSTPVIVAGGRPGRRQHLDGLGDLTLGGAYTISSAGGGPEVELSGRVKLPTSKRSDQLSTQKTDYSVGAQVTQTIGRFAPFVAGSYRFFGDPAVINLKNGAAFSAGSAVVLGRSATALLSYHYARKASALVKDAHELFAGASTRIGETQLRLTGFVTAGVSSGAASKSGGLSVSLDF